VEAGDLNKYTVRDAVERQLIVDISGGDPATHTDRAAVFSPDGSRFIVRTRRGDVGRNAIVERLMLFSTADVLKRLAKSGGPEARSVPVATIFTHDDNHLMVSIQWLSNSAIGFLAEDGRQIMQAFTVNVDGDKPQQLTTSSTDVVAFGLARDSIVYFAKAPNERVVSKNVEGKQLLDLLFSDNAKQAYPLLRVWRKNLSTAVATQLNVPAFRLERFLQKIWVSPDGKHAAFLLPAADAPQYWADYVLNEYYAGVFARDSRRRDVASEAFVGAPRLELLDVESNRIRPLLDAPSGFLAGNRASLELFWLPRFNSVVVTHTYLPIVGVAAAEIARRKSTPAIAEIELATASAKVIAWEAPVLPDKIRLVNMWTVRPRSVDWVSPDGLRVESPGISPWPQNRLVVEFRRGADNWSGRQLAYSQRAVDVTVSEDINSRPKLFATGGACECSREILDPDTPADRFSFGHGEIVHWMDKNGVKWTGEMVLPPEFHKNVRYPLVIQTHGQIPGEFLVDGTEGITTAMAAQPLANAGIVVLQVEDANPAALTSDPREGSLFAAGYKAGIDALAARGIVDRNKVGLIAFSRTGLHLIQMLADYPDVLAAADTSDACWWGYVQDRALYFVDTYSNRGFTDITTGKGRPETLKEALDLDPLYRVPRTTTALRIEANGPWCMVGYYELYTLLKEAGRPVDAIYLPAGAHVLEMPAERLISQGGNVDWFRFWLQDYEDPAPEKREQYTRWRLIREQRNSIRKAVID
jgi:hypothetical protein